MKNKKSLYQRLGGYDAIAALSLDFHLRLKKDSQLGRFWAHRGTDGMDRELQLLVDFLCESTGGPMMYMGRDMATAHIGMNISKKDWKIFMAHLDDSLDHFKVKKKEHKEVVKFIDSLKSEMVEA
jgi:hemoglobin